VYCDNEGLAETRVELMEIGGAVWRDSRADGRAGGVSMAMRLM